jgi:hypothetical protein
MGSYCTLLIGDREYSWKSFVPDIIGAMFIPAEYAANDIQSEWDDDHVGSDQDNWLFS